MHRTGGRRTVAALAVGVVTLAWIAVLARPASAAGPVPERKVWVQGDSVMLGAADDVKADLAGQWSVTVGAFGGLQLLAALDVFRQHIADLGSVVVVELGNNLVNTPAEFGHEIDQAMAIFGSRHVIWLTTALFESRQQAVNDEIWAAAARWPNSEVLDWAAQVEAHPDATAGDGLHLSGSGRALMASLIRDRLNAWYRQFVGPTDPSVSAIGSAPGDGPTGAGMTNGAVSGLAATPSGRGYWLAESDGGVFSYGDAGFFGSAGGLPLQHPIVGMARSPDGGGYWLAAADGGVFSFGDSAFAGSTGGMTLNAPVVAMAATPDGRGYWLVSSDGGIFAFGDAPFLGSTGGMTLNRPIVGMAATPDGGGYWLVGADGGVFSFGDAGFYGSTGAMALARPVETMAATSDGRGYWMVADDGGVFAFGDAPFYGAALSAGLHRAMTARPQGDGYWVASEQLG